jgi:hypothetical protein
MKSGALKISKLRLVVWWHRRREAGDRRRERVMLFVKLGEVR